MVFIWQGTRWPPRIILSTHVCLGLNAFYAFRATVCTGTDLSKYFSNQNEVIYIPVYESFNCSSSDFYRCKLLIYGFDIICKASVMIMNPKTSCLFFLFA